MSPWQLGRAEIDALIASGHLDRVPASREHADRLLVQARAHLMSAGEISDLDPEGAYSLVYDAARKALWAMLANQGLRPTQRGGHIVAGQAAMAQLGGTFEATLRPFDRMRRERRDAEYPRIETSEITSEDVQADRKRAQDILEAVQKVLDVMPAY